MEAYSDFAYVYDTFMETAPYEKWADYIVSLFNAYGKDISSVADLGCGTGKLTMLLSKMGYEMTGVDNSVDMLSVAADRSIEEGSNITYIHQDMTELNLLSEMDAIISTCDCVNYLILDEDVVSCFKCVYENLRRDGIFIFDFNTIYKYETIIGDTTIAESREDCSFIWENFYDTEGHINEYDVTFFVREKDDLYRRFDETHIQRGYDLDEIKRFVTDSGLKFITAIDEATHKEPTAESERIYIVARK